MPENEATPRIIIAKQSTPNSCFSACIGTACGFLSSYGIGERVRDKLEEILGDRSVTLREVAEAARTFCINFVFEVNEHRSVDDLLEAVKGDGVVVIGVNAAAMVITKTAKGRGPEAASALDAYRRKLDLARQLAHGQVVADPDPKREGKTFSLPEIADSFSRSGGQYLVVKTKT